MTEEPPQWELEMVADVADRWDIHGIEAENFLVSVGAFEREVPNQVKRERGD